jgi:uncharacterized protein (UPF0335 family)
MKKLIIVITLFLNIFAQDIDTERLQELDKQNKALFSDVKNYTDKLLENKDKLIQEKLQEFEDDPDALDAKAINRAIKDAMPVAKAHGLDTKKLKKMFELSKKVILRSEFKKYDGDTQTATSKKFREWFDWVIIGEERIAREAQKVQDQRVALYKKVNIAFLRALVEKDPSKSVKEFKRYIDALRSIQSADADVLIAQAELLVAEQQVIADVASGVPLLGDALDIMAISTGEDLSGRKLSQFEKDLGAFMLITPNVLHQLVKRRAAIAKSLGIIAAKCDALAEVGAKQTSKMASKKSIAKVSKALKGNRDIDVWRLDYYKKIKEQKKLAALSKKAKAKLIKEGTAELDNLKVVKRGDTSFTKNATFSNEIVDSISDVAKKRDEIIITRPVNADAPRHIAQGASTKDMFVKGKSAERNANNGIFAGLIPKKQKYSKLTKQKDIDIFQKKVDDSLRGEVSYANYTKKDFKALEKKLKKKKISKKQYDEIVNREIAAPMVGSKQLSVTNKGKVYSAVELPKKGAKIHAEGKVVYKNKGKYFDENFKEIKKSKLKKYDLAKESKFEVLTDTKGNILTADLDLLTVGSKKKTTIMQNDSTMGNINSNEMQTVNAINRNTKNPDFPDQQLVHHGGESSFINKQSAPDFPLVGYSKAGEVVLENEKQLKAYYHLKKLEGYNIEPNPFWKWGEWDPKKGYK